MDNDGVRGFSELVLQNGGWTFAMAFVLFVEENFSSKAIVTGL
jgi:hypothetical protein